MALPIRTSENFIPVLLLLMRMVIDPPGRAFVTDTEEMTVRTALEPPALKS